MYTTHTHTGWTYLAERRLLEWQAILSGVTVLSLPCSGSAWYGSSPSPTDMFTTVRWLRLGSHAYGREGGSQ